MALSHVRPRSARTEYSLLYTATLCLLVFGAVMVYSASSAEALLKTGDSTLYLKRFLEFALIGVCVMHVLSRYGLAISRPATGWLLFISLVLTAAVMAPGVGVRLNGAARWFALGPVRFQPSELLKVALVLYAARLLAARPEAVTRLKTLCFPLGLVICGSLLLVLEQPDMGTAIVICMAIAALLVAAGTPIRYLVLIVCVVALVAIVFAIAMPYRRARLTAFANPWQDPGRSGFQIVQSMIAIGSGGFFGVGLGESVQKFFYLPEAHTDMVLAIIGEELGLLGICGVASLYGLLAYSGLRTAVTSADRYAKLVSTGITSLVLCQASVNFFAVVGMAPLTGVPLPLISYGSSNLIVLLAGIGLVLNAARQRRTASAAERPSLSGAHGPLGVVGGATRGSGYRRDGRPRRTRSGDRRPAAG